MSPEAEILRNYRTVVVVGLSSDPTRPSYRVSRYMQDQGYRVIPVNPDEHEVLGERCYAKLSDVPQPVGFVNVFRRSEFCPEVARAAVAVGAKVLWLQSGIRSEEAHRIAEEAGLMYVEDACMMVTHRDEVA